MQKYKNSYFFVKKCAILFKKWPYNICSCIFATMNVQEEFLNFVVSKQLLHQGDRTLLAVSGGIDSMVMAYLFLKSEFPFAIVHINHQLRGGESDADALFVKKFCDTYSITFYTENIPEDLLVGSNLQEKARGIRYKIFYQIAENKGYDKIATAHHKDDVLETFFINTMRGTGLHGLAGIPVQNDKVIRPLLFATRKDLQNFATDNNILYREDSSNQQTKYTRNFIRHKILPVFDSHDYRKREGFYTTIKNLQDNNELFQDLLEVYRNTCISRKDNLYFLHIEPLLKMKNQGLMLYFLLEKFGFNQSQVNTLFHHQVTGNYVKNDAYILSVEPDFWVVRPLLGEPISDDIHEISHLPFFLKLDNKKISFSKIEKLPIGENKGIDISKLHFPLFLRTWKNSDVFKPLQMKGSKKDIKKLLAEKKIPSFQKKDVRVLIDQSGEVVALLSVGISITFASAISSEGFLHITTEF